MTIAGRPDVTNLLRVLPDEHVLRLVGPRGGKWDFNAPVGTKLQPAALSQLECTPSATSYGASFWLERNGQTGITLAELDAADLRFAAQGVLRIRVGDVEALAAGLYFVSSPDDAPGHPVIAHAHVTLIWPPAGFDRALRAQLLPLFERGVVREPQQLAPAAPVPPAPPGHAP